MTNEEHLAEFVIRKATEEPLPSRVRIYRTLSNLVADPDRAQLRKLATALEEIEASSQQLLLNFRARHGGDS